MKFTGKLLLGACITTLAVGGVGAFAPTNFFNPYDQNLALYKVPNTKIRFGIQSEYGNTSHARDWNGKKKNVLHIHNDHEDVYKMISAPGHEALLTHFGAPDATVGVVYFDGSFEQLDVTPFAAYRMPVNIFEGHTQIGFYMPIRYACIKDVHYKPSTLPVGASVETRAFYDEVIVTEEALKSYVSANGHNLNLNRWSKVGAGDAVAMLKWGRLFKQDKEWIKEVHLHFNGGLSLPTGVKHDVDKAFSVPLGNDGAVGIPFGLGLALNMKHHIKLGADAEFLALFDHTDDYRLKTSMNQSEFLLLDKGRATKEHGLTWKFNLYAKGVHLCKGISIKAAYEYAKHDCDVLIPNTNEFNHDIINSANSLKEWNTHNLIFQLNWDAFKVSKKIAGQPQLSLFYKLPIEGQNVINPHTLGGQLALNF